MEDWNNMGIVRLHISNKGIGRRSHLRTTKLNRTKLNQMMMMMMIKEKISDQNERIRIKRLRKRKSYNGICVHYSQKDKSLKNSDLVFRFEIAILHLKTINFCFK